MSRLYTLEDEQLDYGQDYESVLVVKEIDQPKNDRENEKDLQKLLSLQFYSKKKKSSFQLNAIQRLITEQKENFKKQQENKYLNQKLKTPSSKPFPVIIVTPKCSIKTPQYSKSSKQQILIAPLNFQDSFQKIKLLVSKQQKHQLDFSKFKRSIY
ncbi:unnamed protein product [Paramecium octaurelia]|uniref:Uncharacterized protein n=1 Tax=Paramecium octaurelia TaxID=43137 RepID=A0A8S1VW13_PAROT|nr:unnamed protein product [Paramecium octaurelia]